MNILLIIIILVFSVNTMNAQLSGQAKIDSLLKELPKMIEDTIGVNLLQKLSFSLYQTNPDKGIEYGLQGLELAKNIKWKQGEAACYNALGANTIGKSDYPKALEYYHKALKIMEELGNKSGIASILGNIGNIYYYQSNYPKTLEYYHKALKIKEELGNKSGIAAILGNIGNIYFYQSNYPKALEYYHKSLKINEEIGNKSGLALNLGYIGGIYAKQSNYPKALEYNNKALKINEELGNKSGIAFNLGNIGELYLKLSQDSVLSNISEGTELVSLKKEINLNKSIEYSLQAIELFEEIGELKNRSESLENLAEAYKQKEDYKKWGTYLKESHKLKDSVFNQENNEKLSNLEKLREDDLNRMQIEKQAIQLEAQENEKQLIIYSAAIVVVLVILILALVINSRRKSNKLLLNVLPAKIAKRLKAKEHPIADHFDGASIMFVDIVGFTTLSSDADPKRIVSVLNDIFIIFDKLADKHGLEKIKTIGDAYMAVAGIPEIQTDHSKRTANMALDIKKEMKDFKTSDGTELKFRIGIDCGAVVAGVIGEKKFIYDLWSDAVNTASRMESTGEKGQIQITENFKEELEKYAGDWKFELRGEFDIKGKGLMQTYFLGN